MRTVVLYSFEALGLAVDRPMLLLFSKQLAKAIKTRQMKLSGDRGSAIP